MISKNATARFFSSMVLFLAIAACEQPSGDSEGGSSPAPKNPTLLSASVVPVYLGATQSYLRIALNCKGYSVIEFTYQSALTPKTTTFKQCPSNSLTQQFPVQQGTTAQFFQIKIVGYEEQPAFPSSLPYNLTKNFNPTSSNPTAVAGYGITSGGGPTSGGGIRIINQSVGEVFVGTATAPGNPGATARNGLQGNIDP